MNIEKLNSQNYSFDNLKMLLILGLITPLMLSCSSYKKDSIVQKSVTTVKIIIQTDSKIDHLVFTKFGGFTKEDLMPFQETLTITSKESINDLYQLLVMRKEQAIIEQLWLKGENITIKGKVENGELQIDTVINSPFYYYAKNTMAKYEALNSKKGNQEQANNFLLQEIKKNIGHPFSNILASKYMDANISTPEKLQILAALICEQEQSNKDHILSVHDNLSKLVDVTNINFSDFKFIDINGQTTNFFPEKNALYLLDFWFTNCAPCIADHKILQSQLMSFKEAGINIIGISVDYEQEKWVDFLKEQPYKWDNYLELNEDGNTLTIYLGVSVFPTYLIMNGNGDILNKSSSIRGSIEFLKAAEILK